MKILNRVQVVALVTLVLAFLFGFSMWVHGLCTPTVIPDLYSGVLVVKTDLGQGSCFVVAQRDGWVYAITADHVTGAALSFTVDDEDYSAEMVHGDVKRDIALIRFKSSETYRIYAISRAKVGESCTTVGWSQGGFLRYRGNIVSLDFDGRIIANGGVVPGCSGGALLNAEGEVIGVTVAVATYNGQVYSTTALYVPARFIDAIIIAGIGD